MDEEKTYTPRWSGLYDIHANNDVSIDESDTLRSRIDGERWHVVVQGQEELFYVVPHREGRYIYTQLRSLTVELVQELQLEVVGSVAYLYESERGF